MKLWHSPASPYVRKVMIFAHETGLVDQLELLDASTTAINPNPKLAEDNPVNKVPTLVTDEGTSVFDSRVICEFLDGLHDGDKLIPVSGTERFNSLTTQSMGDGILDSAVGVQYEKVLRPEDKQWQGWIDAQMRKVTQTLDVLETWRGANLQDIHIGSIAVVSALGYLDFRQPQFSWREGRPLLTQMYETFSKRKSMIETKPD